MTHCTHLITALRWLRFAHKKTTSIRCQQGWWNLGSNHWGSIATYERQKESRRHRHEIVTVSELLESERLRHATSQKLARVEQSGRQRRHRAFPQANWECHWLVKLGRYKRTNNLVVYCLKFRVMIMKLCQLEALEAWAIDFTDGSTWKLRGVFSGTGSQHRIERQSYLTNFLLILKMPEIFDRKINWSKKYSVLNWTTNFYCRGVK